MSGAHMTPLCRPGVWRRRGDVLVRTTLVLAAHVEDDVLPAVSLVRGQAARHALGALCEDEEPHVRPRADDAPDLGPPGVGVLKEKSEFKATRMSQRTRRPRQNRRMPRCDAGTYAARRRVD